MIWSQAGRSPAARCRIFFRYNGFMSASCVGTCSHCGVERFWLSDTLSIQLDDGRLKCLPHPAESGICERDHGLTLTQASDRRRLFRETFYVCRNCGRTGETIEKEVLKNRDSFTVCGTMKWGWGAALIIVPAMLWMGWRQGAIVVGITLLASPGIQGWENRKKAKELAARGLPRADAPGECPIAPPLCGCGDDTVIGRTMIETDPLRATGPCCDNPDWIEAFRVKDEDRVPCCACNKGIMRISQHSVH